jgi:hypothetical protein
LLARRNSPLLNMAGMAEADRMAAVVAVPTVAEADFMVEAGEDFTATPRFAVVEEDSAAA